jgi:hypothetical protein
MSSKPEFHIRLGNLGEEAAMLSVLQSEQDIVLVNSANNYLISRDNCQYVTGIAGVLYQLDNRVVDACQDILEKHSANPGEVTPVPIGSAVLTPVPPTLSEISQFNLKAIIHAVGMGYQRDPAAQYGFSRILATPESVGESLKESFRLVVEELPKDQKYTIVIPLMCSRPGYSTVPGHLVPEVMLKRQIQEVVAHLTERLGDAESSSSTEQQHKVVLYVPSPSLITKGLYVWNSSLIASPFLKTSPGEREILLLPFKHQIPQLTDWLSQENIPCSTFPAIAAMQEHLSSRCSSTSSLGRMLIVTLSKVDLSQESDLVRSAVKELGELRCSHMLGPVIVLLDESQPTPQIVDLYYLGANLVTHDLELVKQSVAAWEDCSESLGAWPL